MSTHTFQIPLDRLSEKGRGLGSLYNGILVELGYGVGWHHGSDTAAAVGREIGGGQI